MFFVALLLVSLGFDTLAVSMGLGLAGLSRDRWLRVGLVFALCEGLMPIVGLLVGRQVTANVGAIAQYCAALILIVVGVKAIHEATSDDDEAKSLLEGRNLLLAGLSVSLDELAVGFSLGSVKAPILMTVTIIAAQAFAVTLLGLSVGHRFGKQLGEKAEFISGSILVLLGIIMFVNQALSGRLHFTKI